MLLRNFVFAALCTLAAALSAAAEGAPVVMQPAAPVHPMKQLWRDIDQLNFDIEQVHIRSWYCKPPEEPNKAETDFQIGWLWLDLRKLQDSYRGMEAAYKASYQTRLGASYRAGFPSLDGLTPNDQPYWARTHQMLAKVEGALRAKDQSLRNAPERPCGKSEARTETRIGEDAAVDPLAGLSRPVIDTLVIPSIPAFFCTDLERRQWLIDNFNPIYLKAAENAETAARYRAEVSRRANAHLQADGDKAVQARLNAEERWADQLYKEHDAMIPKTESIRRQILSTPLIECEKQTSSAMAIGGEVLTQPAYENVSDTTIPSRFCTEAEKDAAEAAVKAAADAAWRNYGKAGAKLTEIATLIGKGENGPAVQAAFDEANEATGKWFERGQQLDALLQKLRQTPVVPCDQTAGEGEKEIGYLPTGDTGALRFVRLDALAAYVEYAGPTQKYLALEGAGDLEPRLGAVRPDTDDDTSGLGIMVTIDTTKWIDPIRLGGFDADMTKTTWFNFGVGGFDSSIRQRDLSLEPDGDNLGIPGTGDLSAMYPYGVLLSAPNDVTGISYDFDSRSRMLWAKWGQDCWYEDFIVSGFGGLTIGYQDIEQRFGGAIPDYLTDFQYQTQLKTRTYGAFGGARIALPIRSVAGLSAYGFAEGSFNAVNVEGWDSLTLSGFIGDSQQVDLSEDGAGWGVGLGVGFDWKFADRFGATLGLSYWGADTHPVVVRDGSTPSRVELEWSDQVWIGGGLNIRF